MAVYPGTPASHDALPAKEDEGPVANAALYLCQPLSDAGMVDIFLLQVLQPVGRLVSLAVAFLG